MNSRKLALAAPLAVIAVLGCGTGSSDASGDAAEDGGTSDAGSFQDLAELVPGGRVVGRLAPNEQQIVSVARPSTAEGYFVLDLEVASPGADVSVRSGDVQIMEQRVTAPTRVWWAVSDDVAVEVEILGSAVSQEALVYSADLEWNEVVDDYESNDTSATASPIAVGEPVTARLFAGITQDGAPEASAFADWWTAELEPGNYAFNIVDFGDMAADLTRCENLDTGETVDVGIWTLTPDILGYTVDGLSGGAYGFRVGVWPQFTDLQAYGVGDALPPWLEQTYQLELTGPYQF